MQAGSAAASVARVRAIKGAILSAAVIAALVVAPAATLAAKGGGGGTTPSITLATGGGATALAVTPPALGTVVWFNVVVPSNVNNPRVEVLCYQGTTLVYGEAGSVGQATGDGTDTLGYSGFLLGGGWSLWLASGGAAECTANLYYFGQHAGQQTYNVIATTHFSAAG
jgi:hypothetical protein